MPNDDSRVNRCLALVQSEKVEAILSEKNPILGDGEVEDFTVGTDRFALPAAVRLRTSRSSNSSRTKDGGIARR